MLIEVFEDGLVDMQEALRMSTNPDDFALRFSGVAGGGDQFARSTKQSKGAWESEPSRFELEIDNTNGDGDADDRWTQTSNNDDD